MNGLDPKLSALVDDLHSPDPLVRDTGAYASLAALQRDGTLDDHLVELGDRALELIADKEVQSRSFGAVMAVLRRDLLAADEVRVAVDALAGAWRNAEGPVSAEADNAVRLARTLHLQLVLGVRPAPDTDVVHPAVRLDALRALGAVLAEVHWFYGTPT